MSQLPSGDTPRTRITTGAVRGTRSGEVDRFLGIPYAKPPFGPRRFALPEAADSWSGERDAFDFGPTAPQAPYGPALTNLLQVPVIDGDDILTVNVWTPTGAEGAPVVLWLHGGALERGTTAQPGYDGSTFARDGVVFVSANHRLGVEGFSVLDDGPVNLGLLDAALALEWVHREIAAFGGDPTRITLMGESAGGALVAALLSRPQSRSLVSGAIIQSGPLDAQPRTRARRASDAVARRLGIATTRDAFSAVAPDRLVATRFEIASGSSPLKGAPGFALTLDEDSLPASPADALVEVDIPLLIGTNTDEYRLWLTPEALDGINRLKAWAARRVMRMPERAFRAAKREFPDASPGELLGQLITDRVLRAPATLLAKARTAPTFVYEFAWQSPVRGLRAAHAIEIGFAFDRLDDDDAVRLSGPDAPHALAESMHAAWVSFITTGHPGWPAFGTERTTRVWNHPSSTTVPQPRASVVDALG